MTDHRISAAIVFAVIVAASGCARDKRSAGGDSTRSGASAGAASTGTATCSGDNGGLTLPPSFCATIFADSIGHVRHVVVAPNGDVYVNTWSGIYFGGDKGPPGGYLVMLRDTTHDGRADVVTRFGAKADSGGHGGTGIGLSICKKIIEDHHGRISARSEPGRGAVFSFVLPASPA